MAKKLSTIKKYQLLKSKRDSFYNSLWLNKFINYFIVAGKKFIVEKAFFHGFSLFKQRKKWKYDMPQYSPFFFKAHPWYPDNLSGLQQQLGRACFLQKQIKEQIQIKKWGKDAGKSKNNVALFITTILMQQPLYILLRSVIKNKPLFTVVSKRMGRIFRNIPVPLPRIRQLTMALRSCSTRVKTNFSGPLWEHIYYYLLSISKKQKKQRKKERVKSSHIRFLVSIRTNLHFRWY